MVLLKGYDAVIDTTQPSAETIDVSKRIGVGKGLIEESEDFDKWNDKIADLFEGVEPCTILV